MKKPVPASFHIAMIFALASALVATPESGRANEAALVDPQYTWDLTEFYSSKAAWETELERLRSDVDFLAPYAGKLGDDAATLLAALEANSTYGRELSRLWTYASNLRNTNLGAPEGQEMVGRMQALAQSASAAQSFFVPEIVSLGEATIMAFIAAEPGLEKHSLFLRDTLRQGEHVLSPESEQVLSLMATALSLRRTLGTSWPCRNRLPTITLSDGTEALINNAGYGLYRQAANRADRIAVRRVLEYVEAVREHSRCNVEWGSAGKCSDGKSSRLRKFAGLLPLWGPSSDSVSNPS